MTREIDNSNQLSAPTIKMEPAHRAEYMKLLELHNQNRIDYNVRKWETIKFGQTIATALILASITAYFTAVKEGLFVEDGGIKWLIASLAFAVTICCLLTSQNLQRESARLFEEEGMMFKLAKLLDLDIRVSPLFRWIPNDEPLLMHKWRECTHKIGDHVAFDSYEDWVEKRTSGHQFLHGYGMLFTIFAFFGLIVSVFTILTH